MESVVVGSVSELSGWGEVLKREAVAAWLGADVSLLALAFSKVIAVSITLSGDVVVSGVIADILRVVTFTFPPYLVGVKVGALVISEISITSFLV